jgi:hypothetical protein
MESLRAELIDLHAGLCGDVLRASPTDASSGVQRFLGERAALLARIDDLQRRALASDRPSALAAVTKALQKLRG